MRAAEIAKALGGKRSGRGFVARCPAHRDRNPSLSISDGADGKLLLHCHRGCSFDAVIDALRRRGVVGHGETMPPPAYEDLQEIRAREAESGRRKRHLAQSLWNERRPIRGTIVERYLASRAISAREFDALGFHPALRHPSGAVAPALLAAIVDRDGAFMGLHRTWLEHDGAGKALLKPPKAMLGAATGGAVRLSDQTGELIVAEGIETALSLLDAFPDRRVWAALSANGLRWLDLPDDAAELLIGADGDPAGRSAASGLAERACRRGWRVRIMTAPEGLDWNDVAQRVKAEPKDGV